MDLLCIKQEQVETIDSDSIGFFQAEQTSIAMPNIDEPQPMALLDSSLSRNIMLILAKDFENKGAGRFFIGKDKDILFIDPKTPMVTFKVDVGHENVRDHLDTMITSVSAILIRPDMNNKPTSFYPDHCECGQPDDEKSHFLELDVFKISSGSNFIFF